MLQILHKTNIDFMGWKNISFSFSALLDYSWSHRVGADRTRAKRTLASILSAAQRSSSVLKMPVPIDKARAALEKNGFQGSTIQEVGEGGNKILIRLRESEGTSDKVQNRVQTGIPG